MRTRYPVLAAVLLVVAAIGGWAEFPAPPADGPVSGGNQVAVLAGGCFWGVEAVFERLRGVVDAVSGYSGGERETARYEAVGSGRTGHAESVRVTYDPSKISFGTLLKVFFSVAHDPTQLNYQGPDVGTQYRSAVFYANADQKRVAEEYIRTLDRARVYRKSVVTQVVPLVAFFAAEEYHQNFLDRNPTYPYIVYWDLPKIEDLKKTWPEIYMQK